MTKNQKNRKVYVDVVGIAKSVEEIVPLGYALDQESEEREANRQLNLPVREFDRMAREGGFFINKGLAS